MRIVITAYNEATIVEKPAIINTPLKMSAKRNVITIKRCNKWAFLNIKVLPRYKCQGKHNSHYKMTVIAIIMTFPAFGASLGFLNQ